MLRRCAIALLLVGVVVGCSALPISPKASPTSSFAPDSGLASPTPSDAPSPEPTEPPSAEPTKPAVPDPTLDSTPRVTEQPTSTVSASATDSTSAILAIDAFWLPTIDFGCWQMIIDKQWDSIGAMTKDTELIVTGRPVGLSEDFDSAYGLPVRVIEIAVNEVLKGTPVETPNGLLRIVTYRQGAPDLEIPSQEHLLFLRNVGSDELAVGDTPTDKQRSWYWLSGMFQNVFANVDGRVTVPLIDDIRSWVGEHEFPVGLRGEDFDELVATVRSAVKDQADAGRRSAFAIYEQPFFAC